MPAALAEQVQTQIRCSQCRLRLLDFVNEIRSGRVLLEIKCPRCHELHMQLIGELKG